MLVPDHCEDRTYRHELIRPPHCTDAMLRIAVEVGQRGLKREESVRAEHYLIFVAVIEDCLARVVVADLRSKQ
jgi:hypothetical protein